MLKETENGTPFVPARNKKGGFWAIYFLCECPKAL